MRVLVDGGSLLADTRGRLAPDRIGAGGQLQEWLDDWDMTAPERQHRHVSHLYAVYPSAQLSSGVTPGALHLLPALPKAWPAGKVTGLRARGGFEVDLEWQDGTLRRATVRSTWGMTVRLRAGTTERVATMQPGDVVSWDGKQRRFHNPFSWRNLAAVRRW